MQRVQLVDLRKHLNRDLESADSKLAEIHGDLEKHRTGIADVTDRIGLTKRDGDKLGMAAKSFNKSYQKYSAVSLVEVMKSLNDQHENAERTEDIRKNDQNIQKMASALKSSDLVDKLRLKDPELRTKDERCFIGMDVSSYLWFYQHRYYIPVIFKRNNLLSC